MQHCLGCLLVAVAAVAGNATLPWLVAVAAVAGYSAVIFLLFYPTIYLGITDTELLYIEPGVARGEQILISSSQSPLRNATFVLFL